MPRRVFDVFLSSTSKDLEPCRAKVREKVLGLQQASVCMETFGAKPASPLDTCRQEVLNADALVVIVGHRYGWVPGAMEGGDQEKSITWWEVQWALDAGKPVYAYLIDKMAPWTGAREEARLVDAGTNEEASEVWRAVKGLERFRSFLERTVTRKLFTSPEDLAGKVAVDLANWIRAEQSKVGATGARLSERPAGREFAASRAWTGSPFPGLRAFTSADAPIFFGRRRETDFLVARLCDSSCRFLLVVGASGSGKSSLVAAGLIPRLATDAIPGSEDWLLPVAHAVGPGQAWLGPRFTPAEHACDPFLALADKLAPMLTPNTRRDALASQLAADPGTLPGLMDGVLAGRPASAEAVLFVDQFEELITMVHDEPRRRQFVQLLDAASRSPRIRVVGTVRADFYHRCIETLPALAELLRDCGVTVPLATPGYSALREMIDGPAERAGLTFDDGLVDALMDETVSHPGGLALLAFALHELHGAREPNGRLSKAAYQAFGGLSGVINTRAEAAFTRLPGAARDRLASVFSQLVVVNEFGVATRNRSRQQAVVGSSPDAGQLVDAFVEGRLLVSDTAPDGTRVLEVAHEALLREWPRLNRWIRERSDDLRLMQLVEAAARDWERSGRLPHYGWPHERLIPVHESLARLSRHDGLAEPVRSFVRPESEWLCLELDKPETTHLRRAAIGERLDQIGDQRAGVSLRPDGTPDIVWCEVRGGSVTLEVGTWHFNVTVIPFFVAKYLVTYRQYKAFLDDPQGYRNEAHWKGLHHEPGPGEQYRRFGNHPAENVSWYDATAFCRWLSARLGFEVRLPHEAEWQQAATGGNVKNLYPWGPDWRGNLANTTESRLGRTIAVGMYPQGRSAQGVLDLTGNVWEWCCTTETLTAGIRKKERGTQVVRGGSWINAHDGARATFRGVNAPDLRFSSFGFRVVCASPIP